MEQKIDFLLYIFLHLIGKTFIKKLFYVNVRSIERLNIHIHFLKDFFSKKGKKNGILQTYFPQKNSYKSRCLSTKNNVLPFQLLFCDSQRKCFAYHSLGSLFFFRGIFETIFPSEVTVNMLHLFEALYVYKYIF